MKIRNLSVRGIPPQLRPVHVLVDALTQSLSFDLAKPPRPVDVLKHESEFKALIEQQDLEARMTIFF